MLNDSIVNPGTISGHVHSIAGGSNFDRSMTLDSALESQCTTAPIVRPFILPPSALLTYRLPTSPTTGSPSCTTTTTRPGDTAPSPSRSSTPTTSLAAVAAGTRPSMPSLTDCACCRVKVAGKTLPLGIRMTCRSAMSVWTTRASTMVIRSGTSVTTFSTYVFALRARGGADGIAQLS